MTIDNSFLIDSVFHGFFNGAGASFATDTAGTGDILPPLDAVEVLFPSVEAAVLLALLEPAKALPDISICALAVVLTRCFTSSLEMASDCCISLNDFVGALDPEMILAGSG